MAVIACPNCGKKISSRAALCSFCGFELGEATAEDFERFRWRRLRDQRYRLNMVSYAVMSVVLAAFGWHWWDSEGFAALPSRGPMILLGVAAVAYLAVRVMLFRNRQRLKAMRRERPLQSGPGSGPR